MVTPALSNDAPVPATVTGSTNPALSASTTAAHSQNPATVEVPAGAQIAAWLLIVVCFIVAIVIYRKNFKAFKQNYAELSERLDGHIESRADGSSSPGHAYALASRGPTHARDAEIESATARWRHLSLAFPNLGDHLSNNRPLILVKRPYTNLDHVEDMQQMVCARVKSHAAKTHRSVVAPTFIGELGEDFDALRHPQLAIANPAIYTFPFFLTWQRRHQWGVLPYGVHNRLGVICTTKHPALAELQAIERQYRVALTRMKSSQGAFWVNDPSHAIWVPLLLQNVERHQRDLPALMKDFPKARVFSVGAYLHKELLPLACAVLPDSDAGARYTEYAKEIEVSDLDDQLKDGPDAWPAGSAIIADLAVIPDDLEQKGWQVLRLAHCVYVPIGIGYSVAAIPLLRQDVRWRNDMLRDAGSVLLESSLALAKMGIELDERLWEAKD
jgi:hypothetical protein